MSSAHWAMRAHAVCSTIAWCCLLNLYWLIFTMLGAIVAGIGPSTVAACVLARRRSRGEAVDVRDFAIVWRREFRAGNAVVLPVVVVIAVLWTNYLAFSGPDTTALRLTTLGALVVAIAIGSYVAPMYAHYDLPLWQYVIKASRFALARPASTVLLVLVFATIAFATAAMPLLVVVMSVGTWLHTTTWLCVRFFAENEDRLAAPASNHPPVPERALPTEPLRIR
jgi:uncharacterized membrane protein YesL